MTEPTKAGPDEHGNPALLDRLRKLLGCQYARISKPCGRLFLIIGDKKRSAGQWTRNGVPFDFDYIDERCVASGSSEAELIASAREYKRLIDMPRDEWIAQVFGISRKAARRLLEGIPDGQAQGS